MVDGTSGRSPGTSAAGSAARLKSGVLKGAGWGIAHPVFGMPKRKRRLVTTPAGSACWAPHRPSRMDSAAVDRFEASRGRLASLAYRLLGWPPTPRTPYRTRSCAGRPRITNGWRCRKRRPRSSPPLHRPAPSAQARYERAAGAWLPEPLLAGDLMLDPADTFEQRESVALAVLTLMERLAGRAGRSRPARPSYSAGSPGSSTSPSPRASSTSTGRGAGTTAERRRRGEARTPRRPAGSSRSSSPPPRQGARNDWWRCSPTT
ncbi:hypothetical protein LV779_25000 [Streptomyces thinghirensis]|nr:hypothetical protein [Streptomyces thinghirensis]